MENAEAEQAQLLKVVPTVHVGITGHRVLPSEAQERIIRQVREVLAAVQQETRKLLVQKRATLPQGCLRGEPHFRLLTPLAEGADRLAARQALALGYSLQCPLPFSRAFYEGTFTSDDAEHTEFRELLGKAESVLEIAGSDESFTSRGYADVGSIVVNHSDFLVAIWDGKPSRYIAGTYASVSEARRRHIPVIIIHATETEGEAPIRYQEDNKMRRDWRAALEAQLGQILFPRNADGAEVSLFPLPAPRNGRKRIWLRGIEKLLLGKAQAPGLPHRTDAEPEGEAPAASRLWLQRKQHFSTAVEDMAGHYRNLLLGRLLFPVLATFFLTLALNIAQLPLLGSFLNFIGCPTQVARVTFFVLQILCLLLAVLQVMLDRFAHYHRRFLCYRVMAELCRQTAFLYPMGFADVRFRHRASRPPSGSNITAWYYRMLLREQGLPAVTLTHADLKNWLYWLKQKLLVSQQHYHGNRALRCNILQTRLGLIAVGFYVMGLFATAMRAWLGGFGGGEAVAWLALFASLALIFPPAAVFFSSISQNVGYPAHGVTSRNMDDFFRAMTEEVNSLLDKPEDEIYYTDILRICEDVDHRCREELSDWEDTLRQKPLKWV